MGKFIDWLEAKEPKAEKPIKVPAGGGVRPRDEEELKKFKHADLIVLPDSVEGTNCGNCKYADKGSAMMYCKHHDIEMYVTDRNCCKYWDNKDVKRNWKTES